MAKKKPDKDKPEKPEVVEVESEDSAVIDATEEATPIQETPQEPAPEVAPAQEEPAKPPTPYQLLVGLRQAVREARKGGYIIKMLATYNDPTKGGTTTRL